MSIIKSIKQVLGLGPAAENHFWDGSVPNQLSLKRGTPDAPGAELIKVLNGVLSFPNQGQLLAPNGYVKLPGGLIVQWGNGISSSTGDVTVNFPIVFSARCACFIQPRGGSAQSQAPMFSSSGPGTSGASMAVSIYDSANARVANGFEWIAIGY